MKKNIKTLLTAILASLFVSAGAQDKTPVALNTDVDIEDWGVATNPFSQNWEVALGIQGLAFYSNQENYRGFSQSPFSSFRSRLGIALSVSKWFSPEIALRTKLSGFWGKSVTYTDAERNNIKYFHLHEDVLVNLNNAIWGYNENRLWDVSPYIGVGIARNFTYNETPMAMDFGIVGTYRFGDKMKAFCDLGMTLCGGDFDGIPTSARGFFNSRDRWASLELGVILELGNNKWKKVPDMDNVEIVPWQDTQRELKRMRRQAKDLRQKVDYLENQPKEEKIVEKNKVIVKTPEISIFFEIGSAELKHRGQLENIKRIVEMAKETGRIIKVTGYADSTTGNERLNEKLSARRADTIVRELMEMNVDPQQIKIVIGGGVNTLETPANRRVIVSLE